MALIDDIDAIRADGTKTEAEKRLAIYELKGTALIDVIYNGKPPPQPIPPLVGRTFTLDGTDILVNFAKMLPDKTLLIDVTLTASPALPVVHQFILVNPPVLPRNVTGNEKNDLIQAVAELLAGVI